MGTVGYLPKIILEPLRAPIAEPIVKPAARQEPQPQRRAQDLVIGPLVFRCPTTATALEIESGIEMDLQTFRRVGQLSVHLQCAGCRRPHELKVADGRLASYEIPPSVSGLDPNGQPPARSSVQWNSL